MNKIDLVSALSNKTQLPKSQAKRVIDLFFQALGDGMANGGRVEIRGLCSFSIRQYESYISRNPRNGVAVTVKPKKLPYFRPSIELRERVNR